MATNTGIDAQVGLEVETTYGAGITVTRFYPLINESIQTKITQVESAAQMAGRQVLQSSQWAQGMKSIAGKVSMEFYDQSMGKLMKVAFGTVNTVTAGGTGTHTFFPAAPQYSMSLQVGRPTIYGTVIPSTYLGTKITKWTLTGEANKNLLFDMDIVAQEEDYGGTALAAASYATNIHPWKFQSAVLSVAGVSTPVKSWSISGDNKLDVGRMFLGSTIISEPLRNDLAEYTGQIVPEWGGPSAQGTLNYHRFRGGTESAMILTATSGTLAATITMNVRYDGSTPNVPGTGIVEHTIPYKCVASGADSTAIQVVLVNNDTTA